MHIKIDKLTSQDFASGAKVFEKAARLQKIDINDCKYLTASLISLLFKCNNLTSETKKVLDDATGAIFSISDE